ncbi:MAG: CCA tRNA nucleotidyltransferase [Caldisphaeraceae archaeon]|nr:CCA tRNA nucleotidyltransferase [Caldisphaeraceae archaeon]
MKRLEEGKTGSIESEVLEKIRPTELQIRVLGLFIKTIKDKINECMRTRGIDVIVEEEGSYAKGTLLRDKWEVDLFVLFKDTSDEWINLHSKDLLTECFKNLPYLIKYSQHPYITVSFMGLEADIVPALYIEKPRKKGLGVERTPFHTKYINYKLEEYQKDEVRLLKSFLKGIGVYGAESHIAGFSGYLSELLILYYGNFINTVYNISRWRKGIVIDIEGNGDYKELKRKYKDSTIIVVDPVDPRRNVAASISEKSYYYAVLASKLYMRKPSKYFFHIYSTNKKVSLELPSIVVRCKGRYFDRPPQDIRGRLKRITESIESYLKQYNYNLLKSSFYFDDLENIYLGFLFEDINKSKTEIMSGPKIEKCDADSAANFIKKRLKENGFVFINGDSLKGISPRKKDNAVSLINKFVKEQKGLLPKETEECNVALVIDPKNVAFREDAKKWIVDSLYSMPAWIIDI